MRAAGEDVHHRQRQQRRLTGGEQSVKGFSGRIRSRERARHGHGQDGIGTQPPEAGQAVRGQQRRVDLLPVVGVDPRRPRLRARRERWRRRFRRRGRRTARRHRAARGPRGCRWTPPRGRSHSPSLRRRARPRSRRSGFRGSRAPPRHRCARCWSCSRASPIARAGPARAGAESSERATARAYPLRRVVGTRRATCRRRARASGVTWPGTSRVVAGATVAARPRGRRHRTRRPRESAAGARAGRSPSARDA